MALLHRAIKIADRSLLFDNSAAGIDQGLKLILVATHTADGNVDLNVKSIHRRLGFGVTSWSPWTAGKECTPAPCSGHGLTGNPLAAAAGGNASLLAQSE
jgi:hypothetical protein